MFIAEFLRFDDKTPYNVKINVFEYFYYLINKNNFLKDLSIKYKQDFINNYYFKGAKYVRNNIK